MQDDTVNVLRSILGDWPARFMHKVELWQSLASIHIISASTRCSRAACNQERTT